MCGIFGWSWKKGHAPDLFTQVILAHRLAEGNDNRGGHSWGVWSPGMVVKGLGDAAPNAAKFPVADLFFGHTRYATHGGKVVANTHPFEVEGPNGVYIGAHNGIIYNHGDLNTKYGRKFEVDSQHIFAHIAHGMSLDELDGYGVIQFYRKEHPTRVYLAKLTSSGDLCVLETPHGIVWSSEKAHLEDALDALDITYQQPFKVPEGLEHYVEDGEFWFTKGTETLYAINAKKVDKRTSRGRTTGARYVGNDGWSWETGKGWVQPDEKPMADMSDADLASLMGSADVWDMEDELGDSVKYMGAGHWKYTRDDGSSFLLPEAIALLDDEELEEIVDYSRYDRELEQMVIDEYVRREEEERNESKTLADLFADKAQAPKKNEAA